MLHLFSLKQYLWKRGAGNSPIACRRPILPLGPCRLWTTIRMGASHTLVSALCSLWSLGQWIIFFHIPDEIMFWVSACLSTILEKYKWNIEVTCIYFMKQYGKHKCSFKMHMLKKVPIVFQCFQTFIFTHRSTHMPCIDRVTPLSLFNWPHLL